MWLYCVFLFFITKEENGQIDTEGPREEIKEEDREGVIKLEFEGWVLVGDL
jgi:hypothetical protein